MNCASCFHAFIKDDQKSAYPDDYMAKITCKVCKRSAHRFCYNPSIKAQFTCDPCNEAMDTSALKCKVCLQPGLLKKVTKNIYGHPLCLAFHTNFMVKNFQSLDFIESKILPETSGMKKCTICSNRSNNEDLVKCDMKKCRSHAHIYCIHQQQSQDKMQWVDYIGHLNLYAERNFMDRNMEFYQQFMQANYQNCSQLIWNKQKIRNKNTKPCISDFFCGKHSNLMPLECYCGQTNDNDYVQCDCCLSWMHIKCQGFNQSKFSKQYYECKQCIEWKNIVRLKKKPILNKYPRLHFYDLIYIQMFYEKRQYLISSKDFKLLDRTELKPSISFFNYFFKKEIHKKITKQINTNQIYQNLLKSEVKVEEQKVSKRKRKKKSEKKDQDHLFDNILFIIISMADNLDQFRDIENKIKANYQFEKEQTMDVIHKFQNKKLLESNKSHSNSSCFSVLIQNSKFNEQCLLPIKIEAPVNQKQRNEDDCQIIGINSSQNNNQRIYEKLKQIYELYCNTKNIQTKTQLVEQFQQVFKASSKLDKKIPFIYQNLYLKLTSSMTAFLNKGQQNILNSKQIIVSKQFIKIMFRSLTQTNFYMPLDKQNRIRNYINDLLRQKIINLQAEEYNTLAIFNLIVQYKDKINRLEMNNQTISGQFLVKIQEKEESNLEFLKNSVITQKNYDSLVHLFHEISNISFKNFTSLWTILENKARQIVCICESKNHIIQSQVQFQGFQTISKEFQIKSTWLDNQFEARQTIFERIEQFKVQKVRNKQDCKTWKQIFNKILVLYRRQNNIKGPLKMIIKILQQLQIMQKIYTNIPQWLLFPQIMTFQQNNSFHQVLNPENNFHQPFKLDIVFLREILKQFKALNFPDIPLKGKIEEIEQIANYQCQTLNQLLLQLSQNIVNNQKQGYLLLDKNSYSVASILREIHKAKNCIFDFKEIIRQVQDILSTFFQMKAKMMKAAQQNDEVTFKQMKKSLQIFPIKIPEIDTMQKYFNKKNEHNKPIQSSQTSKVNLNVSIQQQPIQASMSQFKFDSQIFEQNKYDYKGAQFDSTASQSFS